MLSSTSYQSQTWRVAEVACFRRTSDALGDFSNFAKQMPIRIHGFRINSSEHLYQAMRFPHLPEIQFQILEADSPSACKTVARAHDESTREDWEQIRIEVMRWVLAKKVTAHPRRMSKAFVLSEDKPIVEFSKRDAFWGAQPNEENDEVLEGQNVLGCLLTEVRDAFRKDARLCDWTAPAFPRALFLSKPI